MTAINDYITCALGGRLGNNMFMIANAYARSIEFNRRFVITRSQVQYHGNDYSKNIFRKLEFKDSFDDNGYHNPSIPPKDKHSIYVGYFQSERYFDKYSEKIKELFCPTDAVREIIAIDFPQILQKSTTVINVRRGDYLNLPHYHPVVSKEYIEKALKMLPDTRSYIIASDDIPWCKENIKLENAVYLENYTPEQQLWIMSYCDNFIISNSSFSWWAAYLGRSPYKNVIAPSIWFGPDGPKQWNEIYCKGWTVMPTYFKDGLILPQ